MNLFKKYGSNISYKDILEADGAYATCHVNYGKSPVFNGISGRDIVKDTPEHVSFDDILNHRSVLSSVSDIESNVKREDRILRWKEYWLEYVNAFDKMTYVLPDSIVTLNIGRQAIENGFKYLIVKKNGQITKEARKHNLQLLAHIVFDEYNIKDEYMAYVETFCEKYDKCIENGYAEYFRFPEYKQSEYFAGTFLDIRWLSYNFALIILKLLHFAGLDDEF